MIGRGGIPTAAAVEYYLGIEHKLKDKPNEELEGLVKKLTPKVKVDNAIFGSGLTVALSSLLGSAISNTISEGLGLPGEQALNPFLYIGFSSLGATFLYAITWGMGKGLEYRYNRDAASHILKERKNPQIPVQRKI